MDRRLFLSIIAGTALTPAAALAIPRPPSPRRIDLLNAHTGEKFSGPYRNSNGPIPSAMQELDAFLRDFHCGAETRMDVRAIDFLADVLAAVGERKATVLSAYRTPATNAMLAHTIFGVAENSQHMYGRALDIYLPVRLEDAMLAARGMKRGGVGWYPRSHFIHIDSGPVRNWTLDEGGLAHLLLGGKSIPMTSSGVTYQGHGRYLIRGPGRLIVYGKNGPVLLRGRGVLSVRQRLALRREVARAEFLARRVSR